ncbi:MAG: VWA domain-containing protein [Planctomycetes bacterium]|nr:VWA domain-containing protein [Planctomycetota bacterium]
MISKATAHPAPEVTPEFDRSIINTAGNSVRHLVVTVRAPEQKAEPEKHRPPLNIGLVIDASGSMSGAPLDAAKLAALDVIAALADSDHMSLVSFADDAVQHAVAVVLANDGRTTLSRAVQSLVTRGSTDLAAGWLSGCEAVAGRQATCDVLERNHVVLLSDGHANRGQTSPTALAQHANELRTRGIVTSTVGVGRNYSPTQLQAIAEAGGGRMHDAERSEEIARIVMAELTDTLATTVENLEIRLGLPAGTKAELYGTAPCMPNPEGYDLLVGAMITGATRRLVIKLQLPAGQAGSEAAVSVSARWQPPAERETFVTDAIVPPLLFGSARACTSQPRNHATARIVAEQWHAHVYHRAMTLNQDGQERAAAEYVRQELTYLRRYCEGIPEMQDVLAGLGRFGESVLHRYSAVSSKELMLKSYKMSRGEVDRRGRADVDFAEFVKQEDDQRAKPRGV